MNRIYRAIYLAFPVVMVLFSLAACSDTGEPAQPPPTEPIAESSPGPRPAPAAVEMNRKANPGVAGDHMTAQQQVTFAQSDLAGRLGLDPADVSVASSGPVTWRSGALGCPKPGMNYTQALVPGFRIVLQAGNATHYYHAVAGRQPFYCPADRAESPSPSGPTYE